MAPWRALSTLTFHVNVSNTWHRFMRWGSTKIPHGFVRLRCNDEFSELNGFLLTAQRDLVFIVSAQSKGSTWWGWSWHQSSWFLWMWRPHRHTNADSWWFVFKTVSHLLFSGKPSWCSVSSCPLLPIAGNLAYHFLFADSFELWIFCPIVFYAVVTRMPVAMMKQLV